MNKLVTQLLMSLLRHALTAGGLLGVVVTPELETQIAGVVSFVVGLVLIWVDKVRK